MSFIVFCQSLGPAVVLALCQLVFIQGLKTQLPLHAPDVNTTAVIQAGATQFRALISDTDLPDVLTGYSDSIDQVFYLLAGLSAAGGLVLWGMGWQDIRKRQSSDGVTADNSQDDENTNTIEIKTQVDQRSRGEPDETIYEDKDENARHGQARGCD